MSEQATEPRHWTKLVPLGPEVEKYLVASTPEAAASASEKSHESTIDDAAWDTFARAFIAHASEHPPSTTRQLYDLMGELVKMKLGGAALRLRDMNEAITSDESVEGLLVTGSAAMLSGELARAEAAFIEAQRLAPDEPAPYDNLVQIHYASGDTPAALTWCRAGLDVEPNRRQLWEYLAVLLRGESLQESESSPETWANSLRQEAEKRGSWAGISLAAEILDPRAPGLKAELLDPVFRRGERGPEFLVEYTGALGAAGRYGEIPAIVAQALKVNAGTPPWQLLAHSAQAALALGDLPAFKRELEAVAKHPQTPPQALAELRSAENEIEVPQS